MEHQSSISRGAWTVSAATFISRILGFFRDMIMAMSFSAPVADLFLVAFRIPNALRRFVAEGAFSISVVPVYSKIPSAEAQQKTVNALFSGLSVCLTLITVLLMIAAPQVLKLYAPGFEGSPEAFERCVLMVRIMLPYLAFLSLVSLAMGILNSHGHFLAPAIAPVFLNLCLIGAMAVQIKTNPEDMVWVSVGALISGGLQLWLQWPFLKKIGRLPQWTREWWSLEVKRVVQLWFPAMWSVSIIQLTTLIGTRFASLLPKGTITGMYLSERLVELPLGVFAIAVGQASLPVLSKLVKQNPKNFDEAVAHSIHLSSFFAFPAAVALYFLADPIARTFFFRRSFDPSTLVVTVETLQMYAFGLPFGAFIRTFASAYHAHEKMKFPAVLATGCLVLYTALCTLTYEEFRHRGLAAASSFSVMANAIFLGIVFHFYIRRLPIAVMVRDALKVLIASGVMGLALWWVVVWVQPHSLTHEVARWGSLLGFCGAGLGVFLVLCWVLRVAGLEDFKQFIRRRFKSSQSKKST